VIHHRFWSAAIYRRFRFGAKPPEKMHGPEPIRYPTPVCSRGACHAVILSARKNLGRLQGSGDLSLRSGSRPRKIADKKSGDESPHSKAVYVRANGETMRRFSLSTTGARAGLFAALCVSLLAATARGEEPARLVQVTIESTHDGTLQPAVMFLPEKTDGPVPLLVVLHSWSADYRQRGQVEAAVAECAKRGWAMIHPNFRGPNSRPEACASPAARQDVLDAVALMREKVDVDPRRVYLVGSSGGGHMALVMAAHAPELWAGVSAWVPITDLAAWHAESRRRGNHYAGMMEKCCGGAPGDSPEVDEQYRLRSSLPFLAAAKGVAIDLNAGVHDGHTGSVPVSHTLRAFNVLAAANGQPEKQLSDEQIAAMVKDRRVPPEPAEEKVDEPGRAHRVLFRREAGPARVTIFDGGHTGDVLTAIRWLAGHSIPLTPSRSALPPMGTNP